MTRFTDQAWQQTATLRHAILDLPFNRELAEGTLSRDRFQFYVIQDALYLVEYARALAVAAARAPDPDTIVQFAQSAQGAIVVERSLHAGFFERFGIDAAQAASAEPSPTCLAYTNFLLAVAHNRCYEELIAAILPCFWIYWDVGNAIARGPRSGNPYQAWIDTYSDPEFGKAVESVIAIVDRAADAAAAERQGAMMRAFERSTQYEWMFWDSAYRLERWPTPGRTGRAA